MNQILELHQETPEWSPEWGLIYLCHCLSAHCHCWVNHCMRAWKDAEIGHCPMPMSMPMSRCYLGQTMNFVPWVHPSVHGPQEEEEARMPWRTSLSWNLLNSYLWCLHGQTGSKMCVQLILRTFFNLRLQSQLLNICMVFHAWQVNRCFLVSTKTARTCVLQQPTPGTSINLHFSSFLFKLVFKFVCNFLTFFTASNNLSAM